ncbi:MAG TPA: c-type cytochrome biogenesis protein CcmI [Gammaproteobacteria bacterium]|nr:c-type cytochrome biogenesis protein CcmI [Gammaproteobacteria bacterium]HIK69036.1 c-type cytochrome biogenesis protein CcmI [Pseudomonadales bacterium]
MIAFWLPALLLLVVAVAFVLFPLFRVKRPAGVDRTRVNLELFRERTAVLEQQLAEDSIDLFEMETQLVELQQNLLSDIDDPSDPAVQVNGTSAVDRSKKTMDWRVVVLMAAMFVPLCAFLIYTDLGFSKGAISDVLAADRISEVDPNDEASVADMVEALEQTLSRKPDNDRTRFMLGQSYLRLSRFAEAVSVFEAMRMKYPADGNIAARFAEALFLAEGEVITGPVREAIDGVLAINPHSVGMLEILAMDAFRRNDLATAKAHFQHAAEFAETSRAAVIRRVLAQLPGSDSDDSGKTASLNSKAGSSPMKSVSVLVELSSDLVLSGPASVFVFARAVTGPPMPLAVRKLSSEQLPALVQLTEEMAMFPGMSLKDFSEVVLVARISESGVANPSPEDFEVTSQVIQLDQVQGVIKLQISQRRGGG